MRQGTFLSKLPGLAAGLPWASAVRAGGVEEAHGFK